MPDSQDKTSQTSSDPKVPDTPTALAKGKLEAKQATGTEHNRTGPSALLGDDVGYDRAAQASQIAQGRKRDESGRFASDDDGREPQRATRSRNRSNDERDTGRRYEYDDQPRRVASRRDDDVLVARDRNQRNLFDDNDYGRRQTRDFEPGRSDDPRDRWAGQSYSQTPPRDDYARDSRDYSDNYRRYPNEERRQDRPQDYRDRYDHRAGWAQTGEPRYRDDRDERRASWASQGDQQRHRDWDRDDRGGYSSRRDYDEDYTRRQGGYDLRPRQERYRDDRPREYAHPDDRGRYQYNDYRPTDRDRTLAERRQFVDDYRDDPDRRPGRRYDR